MVPVWIALVFFLLGSIFMLNSLPQKEAEYNRTRNDVLASDFILYRQTVLKYIDQNPTVTGNIADATLSGCAVCLPLGYTITAGRWSNYVSAGGIPVVFSVNENFKAALPILYEKSGGSIIIGTKSASGKIISINGVDTGITVPVIVPPIVNNSIVMLGR